MQSRETQITMVKWTNAGGQTKRANERSFVYRPPTWWRWRNVKTTYCYIIIIIIITILTTWITERKTKDTISEQRHTEHNSSISRDRFCTSSPSFPILSLSSSNPLRCLSNSCFSLFSLSSSCLSCASRTLRAADSSLILTAVAPRSASA